MQTAIDLFLAVLLADFSAAAEENVVRTLSLAAWRI